MTSSPWFWLVLAAGAALLVVLSWLIFAPSKADELAQLHKDTAAVFTERGEDLPTFFDPDWMDVRFEWEGDVATITADNVVSRHADYDAGYEAYRICEWAHSAVYERGGSDTDLVIYVDGTKLVHVHDSYETCIEADAS